MTKIKIILSSFFVFCVLSFKFIAKPCLAIVNNPILKNSTTQATDPKNYFNSVLSAIISIFSIVGIVYYIWHIVFAGYHLIASEGDPKKWESAKLELIYATVGLFVVFSIFAILKFVGIVLGVTGLENLQIGWPTL